MIPSMTHATRNRLLKGASLVLIGFGLLNLLVLMPAAAPLMDGFVRLAFLDFGTPAATEAPGARLWIGISGGLMAGWGLTIHAVARRVHVGDPALARALILPGLLTWFAVDGIGSALAGAPFNAVLNLGFLAPLAAPFLGAPKAD